MLVYGGQILYNGTADVGSFTNVSALSVVCSTVYTYIYILYFIFYILYFIFYILYFIFYISYFIFYILYFIFYILYFIFNILCIYLFIFNYIPR